MPASSFPQIRLLLVLLGPSSLLSGAERASGAGCLASQVRQGGAAARAKGAGGASRTHAAMLRPSASCTEDPLPGCGAL